jgi:hypothetical protein
MYTVHLVGYFHCCITMHGFMNLKLIVLQVVHKLTGCYGHRSFISVCITDKTGAYPHSAKFSERPISCDDVRRL